MTAPVTNSSLDVAYWFINKAKQENIYLETEKLQHLLFLAQNQYALEQKGKMLMPCLFLCGDDGFFEPTLKKIFAQGRPILHLTQLTQNVTSFLEKIWQEFKELSIAQIRYIIMQKPIYTKCREQGINSVASWDYFVDKSNDCGKIHTSSVSASRNFSKKVLVSQNGPVVVSQWTPRKINN